jgi:dienelactone hydrolase
MEGALGPRTVLAAVILAAGGAACGTVMSDSKRAGALAPAALDSPPVREAPPHPPSTGSTERPAPRPSLTLLDVEGFPDAVVAPPAEATGLAPVIVVVHGLGDWPERHCEAWRNVTSARAFVLCPRGAHAPERSHRGDTRYTHPAGAPLRRHLDAALVALGRRFGDDADVEHPVFVGFSLGATEVALLAEADPAHFPRVAILEGGLDAWTESTARVFAAGGGKRVLFGCGSTWCTPSAKAAASRIERAGVSARVVSTDVGHTMAPPMQDALAAAIPWLMGSEQ